MLSRRGFLAALPAGAALLFGACAGPPERLPFGPATPTPGEPRRVRLARPSVDMRLADTLIEVAGRKVPDGRRLRFEVVPIDPVRTEVGLNGSFSVVSTDPADWPIDWAGTLNALAGGGNVELALVDSRWVSALARADVLHDLAPLMRGDRWLAAEQYVGNVLEAGRVQGRQLALPLMAYAEGLLYDGAAFRDAGIHPPRSDWRRTDLLDAAQKLTRPGRWGLVPTGYSPSFCTLAWQNGAQVVDGQRAGVDLTEPGTIEGLRFLGDLVHRHRVAPVPDDSADPPWTMLAQGTVAMIGLHAGGLAGWRSPVRPWVELAAWPAAGDRNVTLGNAPLMVGVLKSVPDRDRAFEGLRALAQASAETMLLPPRRTDDLRAVNQALSPADATALADLLRIARFVPGDVPLFRVAPTIGRLLVEPVLRGTRRPEEAADQAQAEVNRILTAFLRRS